MQQRSMDVHGQEEVRLGTAHYLERQGRQDVFLVLFDDGTEGTVTATQLRSMLLDRKEEVRCAKPVAHVTWAPRAVEVHPGKVAAALVSAMPGEHAAEKERALHQAVCTGELEASRVTSAQWSQLSSSVEFRGCKEVLFSSARETVGVREALAAQGSAAQRLVPRRAWDAAGPSFYRQLVQDGHSLDAVVLGMAEGALDLALPAALEAAAAGVFARVPWEYIAGADEARFAWLRSMQSRERLALLEFEESDGTKGFWMCAFASREVKEVMLVDQRRVMTLV